MRYSSPLAVLAAMLMATACATFSPAPHEDDDRNQGPKLLGCEYSPPPPSVGDTNRNLTVRVQMSVDEHGDVTHATPEHRPGYPSWVIEAARRTAMTCRYEPATRDGVAVPYETTKYFSFAVGG